MITNTLKKTVGILGFVTILSCNPAVMYAQSTSPSVTGAKHAGTNLDTLKTKGDQLIQQRLTTLNTFLQNITAAKRLSATDKATFTTNINNAISGLTSLKAKIDGDTDAVTAKADVQSIFLTYRVYAEFDPSTHLLASADTMTTTSDMLTTLATKLQARISAAQASGHDVTVLNTLLADMNAKISDAKTQYTNVESQVSPLTPANYNSNPSGTKATLQTARGEIQTGRTDLRTALSDAKQILAGLKAFKATTSVSPTKTVTP